MLSIFLAKVVFAVYGVCVWSFFCLCFGCQYHHNWLPGKTRPRNDLLCVKWNVNSYTLTIGSVSIWWHMLMGTLIQMA